MQLDQPTVDVHAPLDPEAMKRIARTNKWLDPQALQLVCQDADTAEAYESTKQWVMQWATATTLYQAPVTPQFWEGTSSERANVPFFTVATVLNSLVPQVINGLFYESPPFMIQQRPGTKAQTARAIGGIISFQLEDINFREELRLGITNAILFGTGMWKWGWETFSRERTVYRLQHERTTVQTQTVGEVTITPQEEEIDEERVVEYIDRPLFEHIVNLRHVMVDPGLNVPDIRKAKYVVHRMFMTWEDLDKLRERPEFDVPTKEQLIELFLPPKEEVEAATGEGAAHNPMWDARAEPRYEATTADPFQQPLEVLERWDNNKYMVVLQKKVVICNAKNPYGEIPFLSVGWWDVPEAFWSMGIAKTIGAEQRLQAGITNLWLDNAALNLNGVYMRVRGKSVPTQSIRIYPGKVVEVDSKDDFKPIDRLPAVPEAEKHLLMSQQRAEQISGANEMGSQGIAGASGHSNAARTSAGVQYLQAGAGNRTGDFIEKLANQVIVPFLYKAHELNRALLPQSTIKYILSEELQDAYFKQGGDIIELLNARVKFSILAAAKMQARRNMAQALPILVQFLTNQQTMEQLGVQGLKVDVAEVMRMLFEVSDWKNYNDVVVKMTPDDQKRWQMMQPGAQQQLKGQQAAAMAKQQFDNKAQLIDQENIARAGREVLRQALEQSATPEAITGEPGGHGFGSEM